MAYESGFTSALDSAQNRAYQQAQIQFIQESIQDRQAYERRMDEDQALNRKIAQGEMAIVQGLDQPDVPQLPPTPPGGPQPPMPGMQSQPMIPPQMTPQGPGGPSPFAQMMMPPPGAPQPPGAPPPQPGMAPQAPPSPMAGGMPPGAPVGAPPPGPAGPGQAPAPVGVGGPAPQPPFAPGMAPIRGGPFASGGPAGGGVPSGGSESTRSTPVGTPPQPPQPPPPQKSWMTQAVKSLEKAGIKDPLAQAAALERVRPMVHEREMDQINYLREKGISDRAAAASANAARMLYREEHGMAPKTSEYERLIAARMNPGNPPELNDMIDDRLEYLTTHGGKAKGAAGGGGGGGDQPGGVGSMMLQDKDSGVKYAVNQRSGKAWKMDEDGAWQKVNPNEVPKGAVKVGSGGSMGAREAVFTERELMSANQASRDLANVANLPISASTGVLGGRKQGPDLLDAGKEVLANKVTSQEAQLYTVMAAGLQRSLATIEAVGLMPSGTLTHQMDAVMLKEGDTYLTKLSKLAQARQIVESGIDTLTSNPRVAEAEKQHGQEILARIRKAVPFTQDDIIRLEKAKNPKATMHDIMTKDKAKQPTEKSEATKGGEKKGATVREFKTEAEARASGLPVGTKVKVNGVVGTLQPD